VARPWRWGWPAVMLRLRCAGCSGGYGEAVGALNCYGVLGVAGLPSGSVRPVLRTRWRGNSKLKHSEVRTAARWDRLDDRLPNGAEREPDWSLMLWPRRIESNCFGGQGDNGDRGGHGLARLRRQHTGHITTTKQRDKRDIFPRRLPARPQQQATNAVWRHGCGHRQTTDAERCDAEGMTGQADVLRAHSQGVNGAELA